MKNDSRFVKVTPGELNDQEMGQVVSMPQLIETVQFNLMCMENEVIDWIVDNLDIKSVEDVPQVFKEEGWQKELEKTVTERLGL